MRVPESARRSSGSSSSDGPSQLLTREIVDFTRSASRQYHRAHTSARDVFVDVYSNALALGVVLMIAVSFVLTLRDELAGRSLGDTDLVAARWQVVPADVVWLVLTCLALVGIMSLARRLGPVTVTRAEGAWWLPLPIGRGRMVLPAFRRRLMASGGIAFLAYVPFSVLTSPDRSPTVHASSALVFGVGAVLAVAGAAILQLRPSASPTPRTWIVLGLVPVALLPFLTATAWPLVLVLITAAVLLAQVIPRVGDVPGVELQRGGAVSGHAAASIFFVDTNELRRALTSPPRHSASRRGRRYYARPTHSAVAALVRADVVAFLRLQPLPIAALTWWGICLGLALLTPALPVVVVLGVVLVAGCSVSAGTGTVARRIAVVAELDTLLPISPFLVRCSRILMPALAMVLWMGALVAVLVGLGAGPASLVLLGVIAGPGMGAGAVRAATRPPTDWSTPPVETPFGPVPQGQAASLLSGTDITVVAMIPILLALYLGAVHPWLLIAQVIASAVAVLVQASAR
ncbi:hypothetical protein E8P82_03825 [Arthrobacter echini]|uniref:Uncharacterized protein n=1 Tax=Arthrobacter echini TaxID=1529066 RepID=A0A4S5E8T7_9MICC|nr:DUF6297 family protein [Arthrobacter echini]THJ67962.1 hypothetical protein E8P82_03825 [Arthrobacter echini]